MSEAFSYKGARVSASYRVVAVRECRPATYDIVVFERLNKASGPMYHAVVSGNAEAAINSLTECGILDGEGVGNLIRMSELLLELLAMLKRFNGYSFHVLDDNEFCDLMNKLRPGGWSWETLDYV